MPKNKKPKRAHAAGNLFLNVLILNKSYDSFVLSMLLVFFFSNLRNESLNLLIMILVIVNDKWQWWDPAIHALLLIVIRVMGGGGWRAGAHPSYAKIRIELNYIEVKFSNEQWRIQGMFFSWGLRLLFIFTTDMRDYKNNQRKVQAYLDVDTLLPH